MNEGHNGERAATIRSIKTELDAVNAEIAVLMMERKRVKGRIKSDLGCKVADFNVLMRFVDLEDDPRDELFSLLREGFQALDIGTQTSFLDAIDPQPQPAAKPKRGKTKKAGEDAVEEDVSNGEAIAGHILGDSEFVESESAFDA